MRAVQDKVKVNQESVSKLEFAQLLKLKKIQAKQKMISFSVLISLGLWVSLCLHQGGYLLKESLICSTIIIFFMFLRHTEMNSDNPGGKN